MSPATDSGATSTGIYAQADLVPGTVVADRYRIERLLGIGGMGVVYRAEDLTLQVPVALKVLRPELAARPQAFERFRQELLLARQVSSPHVVRIHDLAQHDGRWLISMDLVDGQSLDHVLEATPQLPLEQALGICRQLAEGLRAAHAKGVVHRDLKPANVLLDAAGDAYISDFGVARSLATSGMTQSGTIIGTPDYLSPEQARGDPVDTRSDLYALGLILYEMLAGQPAFSAGTIAEALAQRMLHSPPPVTRFRPDAPAWVVHLLDRLLRPQPLRRLQEAREVVEAIDRRRVPAEPLLRRIGPARAAALLAVLAMLAGGGWWWMQRAPQREMVATAPLHRLLILPVETEDDADDVQGTALAAYLREAINAVPGRAVVDGERTSQVLQQSDVAGRGVRDMAALKHVSAADRILRTRMTRAGRQWQVRAQLDGSSGPPIAVDGPAAADPLAALRAWAAQPTLATALGAGGTSPVQLTLPDSQEAIQALGMGLRAREGGRLPEALRELRRATQLAPEDLTAWLAQAEAAQAIGERETADAAIARAERAGKSAPDRIRRRIAAERAMLDGDAPAAIAQWRALLGETPDDTLAELGLARAQGAGGDFPAAIAGLRKLVARDPNDARAWFELGKFSILSGDARQAVDDHLVRALVLNKRSRNLYGEAETVNALGIGYGRLGQTADAEEQYRRAVQLRRTLGNRRGVATSLRNLANTLTPSGKLDEAAGYLQEARALHVELGDREGLAAVDNELGLLAEGRGDYRAALAAFRSALEGSQLAGDPHGVAQALNDVGFAHLQLGAYDDAQAYLQRAAQAYATLGDGTGRVRTSQNLGLLYAARGRLEEARTILQRSLTDAQSQQMPEEAAVSYRNLAELDLLQGDVNSVLQHAQQAETLFAERGGRRGVVDVGLLRAQAWLAAGAYEDVSRILGGLHGDLASASLEQQAIAQLLEHELQTGRGDHGKGQAALRQARLLSARSGVRHLQLQAELRRASAGELQRLDASTAALGHAQLRLQWIEAALRQALAARDFAAASKLYSEATALLRDGDYARSWAVHRLGARALAGAGQAQAATDAQTNADSALARMRKRVPQQARAGFDRMTLDAPAVARQ